MKARWLVGGVVFFAAAIGCAAPVDDVDDGSNANENTTVDTPPAANGNGAHQANGLGPGGSNGSGGNTGSGGSSSGGSGGGQAGGGGEGGGVVEPGLSASFAFEDGDKTVSDDSGNGNHGAVLGTGVQMGQTGKVGKAVSFSGLDGRIVVPGTSDLEFTKAATIEFWVRLNSVAAGTILSHVSSAGDGVRVRTSQGNIQVFFIRSGEGSSAISSDTGLLGSTWAHVAIVNDGSELRLYVNGKLYKTDVGGHLATAGTDLVIGQSSSTDNALNGMLDELNWWTVARTPEQICEDAGGLWSSSSCTL